MFGMKMSSLASMTISLPQPPYSSTLMVLTTNLKRWSCTSHLYVLKRNDKRCERHRLNQPRQLARRLTCSKVLSVPSSYQVHQNGGRFSRHCRCNVIQCESYLVNQWRCQACFRCHRSSTPFRLPNAIHFAGQAQSAHPLEQ